MKTFKVGDKVVFRESQQGPVEFGEVAEVCPPDERYPMGGLYIVNLEGWGPVEAFWVELDHPKDICPESEDGNHQVTDGSCDQCGAKNFN